MKWLWAFLKTCLGLGALVRGREGDELALLGLTAGLDSLPERLDENSAEVLEEGVVPFDLLQDLAELLAHRDLECSTDVSPAGHLAVGCLEEMSLAVALLGLDGSVFVAEMYDESHLSILQSAQGRKIRLDVSEEKLT
ncbi:hypothetical protein CL654_01405 [bacterium]|nr:hypothetical protein [bacterium]|tara:strand:- start:32081 stop:32494 length:414 start_codon:yes stop_codon:yes gene_type:complete